MKTKISILIVGLMLMVGCGNQFSQLPPSPEKTYAQSLTIYNDASEAYNAALMLQTPEVKAQWKKDINPLLDAADVTLNLWWEAINTDGEDDAKVNYLEIWNKLFPMLFSLGIIEVKE